MKLHANAPLGPKGRAIMVRRVTEGGLSLAEAAEAAGVSERTAGKWVRRYRTEGEAGLLDRSSAPRTVHNTTSADRVEAIVALRRLRMTGPEIAELSGIQPARFPRLVWTKIAAFRGKIALQAALARRYLNPELRDRIRELHQKLDLEAP